MTARDEFIQAHQQDFVAELRKLVAIKTVSTEHADMQPGLTFLQELLQRLLKAEVRQIATPGNPTILAKIQGVSEKAVVFYGHYDTQPAGSRDLWRTNPFELTTVDGRMYGRGIGDNKGQLMAQILGIYTYLQLHQQLPYTVLMLIEGEEEVGSPNLVNTVDQLKETELAAARLAVVVDGSMNQSGQHVVRLGNRGILGFEMTLTTANSDNHSGNTGNIMPNAVIELGQLLARLYDAKHQRVLIPHFYDGVPDPDSIPYDLIDQLPYDPAAIKQQLGIDELPDQRDYYRKLMFEPTFNIIGFEGGYTGAGSKTIVPHQANVKIDCRLVGHQSIPVIQREIKKMLAPELRRGRLSLQFPGANPPTSTHFSDAALHAFVKVLKTATGTGLVEPIMPGSVPNYVWTEHLKVPTITIPYANFDQHNHVPNENLTKKAFFDGIRVSYELMGQLNVDFGY